MFTRRDIARSGLSIADLAELTGISYMRLYRAACARGAGLRPSETDKVLDKLSRTWARELVAC